MPIEISSVHLWSDSKDVLYWIRGQPHRWNTFVANRTSNIQGLVPKAFWHYVKSSENPADLVSRGVDPETLKSDNLWFNGPSFLKEFRGPGNTSAENIEIKMPFEERKTTLSSANVLSFDWSILERFSSLKSLTNFTSIYIRFTYAHYNRLSEKLKKKMSFFKLKYIDCEVITSDLISVKKRDQAELLWIFLVQQASYRKEIKTIKSKMPLKESVIIKLHPLMNSDLLRVGGRLKHSLLDYSEKYPLILPAEGHLTYLLILDMHHRSLHGGTQLVLCNLWVRYWILNARPVITKVIKSVLLV